MPDGLRKVIELDSFETALPCDASQADEMARRYMTLIASGDQKGLHGGSGNIVHVRGALGDDIALKSLIVKRKPGMDDAQFAREFSFRRRAFDEEYRAHHAVCALPGFPMLYGRGSFDGGPVILMEWVEGLTSIAAFELSFGHRCQDGGFPGEQVAALGLAVAKILLEAQAHNPGFAHRDISPRNIMLRTHEMPLREQFDALRPQACVIDMGSANLIPQMTMGSGPAAAITMQESIWRFGTAEYAAPEMVTSDVEGIAQLRRSSLVDVYALCCVLYELYCGRTPYEFWRGERRGSPYRVKMDEAPNALPPKRSDDAALVEAILGGIRGEQSDRTSMAELHDALASWLGLEDRAADVVMADPSCAGSSRDGRTLALKRTPFGQGGRHLLN